MTRKSNTCLALFDLSIALLALAQMRLSAQTVTYVGGGTGFKVNNNGDICFSASLTS